MIHTPDVKIPHGGVSLVITPDSWTRSTVKIEKIHVDYLRPLVSIQDWIESNERLNFMQRPTRNKCQCCRKHWSHFFNKEEMTYMAFQDKGAPHLVCSSCASKLSNAKMLGTK